MRVSRKLKDYFYLQLRIRKKEDRIRELRQLADSVGAISYGAHHNPNRPKSAGYEDKVETIVMMEMDLRKDIEELRSRTKEVEAIIGMVEDERDRTLLELRYINSMYFKEIAAAMNYSVERIYQLHREILNKLEREEEE